MAAGEWKNSFGFVFLLILVRVGGVHAIVHVKVALAERKRDPGSGIPPGGHLGIFWVGMCHWYSC